MPMKAYHMNDHQDAVTGVVKMTIAWIGALVGGVTLNGAVLTATLIFTVLQIVVLLRDKFFKRGTP